MGRRTQHRKQATSKLLGHISLIRGQLRQSIQSKRAKIQVESATPLFRNFAPFKITAPSTSGQRKIETSPHCLSVESDGGGAQAQVIDPGNGERLTRTVVHGSAVELSHVPLQSNIMQMRNDYPWDTVRDHVDCLLTVLSHARIDGIVTSWPGTSSQTAT
jgi:hypothetical protein